MPLATGKGDVETHDFVLQFNKKKIEFDNKYIGWMYTKTTVTVTNPTSKRFAWKVKTTNNTMFEIRRPVGVINPKETIEMEFSHVPGFLVTEDGLHHFSFYYVEVDAGVKDMFAVWNFKRPDGCKHLGIFFPQRMMEPKCRPARVLKREPRLKMPDEQTEMANTAAELEKLELIAKNEKKRRKPEDVNGEKRQEEKRKEEEEKKKKKEKKEEKKEKEERKKEKKKEEEEKKKEKEERKAEKKKEKEEEKKKKKKEKKGEEEKGKSDDPPKELVADQKVERAKGAEKEREQGGEKKTEPEKQDEKQ